MGDTRIRIEPFGDVLAVEPGESVLAALLRQGRFVRYGCKHGGCGTCRAELLSGECELAASTSFSLSDADREAGVVLLCSTRVTAGEAVFDVSKTMALSSEEFLAGGRVVEHLAELAAITPLAHDIRAVRFHLLEPPELAFAAGQYVEVEVPGGRDEWRSYSMANAPGEPGVIEIIVKVLPGGRFSGRLADLRPGDRLRLRGPLGQFAVRTSHRPMVMIAGGSGLGPIRSMLLDLARTGNERAVTFFFGARTPRDLYLVDELRALERAHAWLTFVPVLGEPDRDGAPWSGATGLVTDAVARALPSLRGYEGYLCGPPGMIVAAIRTLVAAGCKERHVYFDRFVPSG